MLEEILQLIEVAKQAKLRGTYIDVALGKHRIPLTIKEAIQKLKQNKDG